MTTFETFKIPKFDPEHGIANLNSVQENVKDTLYKWAKWNWDTTSSNDYAKINDDFDDYVNSIIISTDSIVASAYSVVSYYYPDHIRECTFKKKIEQFAIVLNDELKAREEKNKKTAADKLRKNGNYKSNTSKSVASDKAITTKAKKTAAIEDSFPTFAEESFPNAESDIFSKMLANSK